VGKRINLELVVGAVIVIAAFGVTTAVAHSGGAPAWQRALMIRSAGLDQRYLETTQLRRQVSTPEPGWLVALKLRSEALDRRYGLTDARTSQAAGGQDWYRALMERSDALDRAFHLGRYAP
jgi:hypothetical protein